MVKYEFNWKNFNFEKVTHSVGDILLMVMKWAVEITTMAAFGYLIIAGFVSTDTEINTAPIIEDAWRQGKIVAVPKVVGENMVFLRLDSFDQLEIGYCNIPEPVSGEPVQAKQILMLMPGLAFDRDFNRIGYGGGFYDR